MKTLKHLISQTKQTTQTGSPQEIEESLWNLLFYSPKMPLRMQQEQLLKEAEEQTLTVNDWVFGAGELNVNYWKWGTGSKTVLITHGWGSKAADFLELITALRQEEDLQIIAFDAPGNGSSEGGLTYVLLYADVVSQLLQKYSPQTLIGHSLGTMANALALRKTGFELKILISITPLVNLKAYFQGMMEMVNTPAHLMPTYFSVFEERFGFQAEYFDLTTLYQMHLAEEHFLLYDEQDTVSPYPFMNDFMSFFPRIEAFPFPGVGHERILRHPGMISLIRSVVKTTELLDN